MADQSLEEESSTVIRSRKLCQISKLSSGINQPLNNRLKQIVLKCNSFISRDFLLLHWQGSPSEVWAEALQTPNAASGWLQLILKMLICRNDHQYLCGKIHPKSPCSSKTSSLFSIINQFIHHRQEWWSWLTQAKYELKLFKNGYKISINPKVYSLPTKESKIRPYWMPITYPSRLWQWSI